MRKKKRFTSKEGNSGRLYKNFIKSHYLNAANDYIKYCAYLSEKTI